MQLAVVGVALASAIGLGLVRVDRVATHVSHDLRDDTLSPSSSQIPTPGASSAAVEVLDQMAFLGNGVLVGDPPRVLTLRRDVDPSMTLYVRLADGAMLRATLIDDLDNGSGVATLRLHAPDAAPRGLVAATSARLGERVHTVGRVGELRGLLMVGIVASVDQPLYSSDSGGYHMNTFIRADAPTEARGCGWVNDRGELVGVGAGTVFVGNFSSRLVRAATVTPAGVPSGAEPWSWLGIDVGLAGERHPVETGAFARRKGGVAVLSVRQGSEAERLGIRRGDVLVAVDGTPVSSRFEFVRVCAASGADRVIELTWFDAASMTTRRGSVRV